MATSSIYFVISVLLLGQAFAQPDDFEYSEYDNPPPFQPSVERDQTIDGCLNKVMDIYFILDSSTSIYVLDYRRQQQFVRDVVTRLDVKPSATRVGILTFSDQVNERPIELNRYSNKGDVLASITEQNLPYRTGITNTDQAIRYVRENREFRQDITKVIVVITDGGSRSPGQTARESELARQEGFYLFVIGVGQYLDENEWQAIASDPDNSFIYNITNFLFLDSVKYSLPNRACSLPPLSVGNCRLSNVNYANLFYVATGRVLDNAYQISTNFVDKTRGETDNVLVKYIFDNCNSAGDDSVPFGAPDLYCTRYAAGNGAPFLDLINQADSAATDARLSRDPHNQIVILFLDDDSLRSNSEQIRNKLIDMKADGVEIIVVDISRRGVGTSLITLIANRDNYVRFINGIGGQELIHKALVERTCEAITNNEGPGPV